jgi:hypothetical protein
VGELGGRRSLRGTLGPTGGPTRVKTGVNPPKTPVTKGSNGVAAATMPNICKMPGPPAPFVPTPLPNIGQSSDSLDGCTKDVLIESNEVAIKGSTFKSKGDLASQSNGGGLISSTVENLTKFVAPGAMDVQAEGGNVQLLSDATTNNNSNPPNSGTTMLAQAATSPDILKALQKIADECNDSINEKEYTKANPPSGPDCTRLGRLKHTCCEDAINDANNPKVKSEVAYGPRGGQLSQSAAKRAREAADKAYNAAKAAGRSTKGVWISAFSAAGGGGAIRLDVVVLKDAAGGLGKKNIAEIHDFKFNCKEEGEMDPTQREKYENAFDKTPNIIHSAW